MFFVGKRCGELSNSFGVIIRKLAVIYLMRRTISSLFPIFAVALAQAQSSNDTWTSTGSLNIARGGHTATLLHSGSILVAGGYFVVVPSGYAPTNTELFSPDSETWTNTGSLTTGRAYHTATLLPNCKVLVAGGADTFGNVLSSVEVYDPITGTWSTTNAMTAGRYNHTATLLPDGKVLVVGGRLANNSAELFDPKTGIWTNTSALNAPHELHTTTLLTNGQLLVAGGGNFGIPSSKAELYDPLTGIWTNTETMTIQSRINKET